MTGSLRSVLLTQSAEQDLQELNDFVAEHDAPAKADALLDKFARLIDTLAHSPERGAYPRELLALGIKDFRQVLFKPYRVIYRIDGQRVIVMAVLDGRRELTALLARRLLR